ncbi:MAG TPA: lysophospholipid acyltransferase family protein [Solirubrobacteraceae bacterium]|nr:lysophospholipid acyltransferase family protein [Solirubrobacteraceae bacterium]
MTNEEAHRLAREKGVSRPLYAVLKAVLQTFARLYFRLRIEGAERIPRDGAVIIAPNHKSFWDPFFIGVAMRRRVRFMGKSELFERRTGRLLVRLGAFPVRRGTADTEAMETARTVLRQGGVQALFPEGTRIRDPDELGKPRSGAGRLALEAGAPLVPAAISGTERLFLGPLPKPKRVAIFFGEPIDVEALEPSPDVARELVADELWPEVQREFGRLRARRGLIAAGIAALGLGAGAVAMQRRRVHQRRKTRWRRTKKRRR